MFQAIMAGVFFRRLRKKLKQNKTQTQGFFQKNSRIFRKNSRMTSLLLSNDDVIRHLFSKKLKVNLKKLKKKLKKLKKKLKKLIVRQHCVLVTWYNTVNRQNKTPEF